MIDIKDKDNENQCSSWLSGITGHQKSSERAKDGRYIKKSSWMVYYSASENWKAAARFPCIKIAISSAPLEIRPTNPKFL